MVAATLTWLTWQEILEILHLILLKNNHYSMVAARLTWLTNRTAAEAFVPGGETIQRDTSHKDAGAEETIPRYLLPCKHKHKNINTNTTSIRNYLTNKSSKNIPSRNYLRNMTKR